MTRFAALAWLIVGLQFLGSPCVAADKEPIPKKENQDRLDPLSEQLLWLWRDDIVDYQQHTADPKPLRPDAEEFLRVVQLGMLPKPRGPGVAKTVAMGKELFDRGCNDPLVKMYYGVALSIDQGIFAALPWLIKAREAWPQFDYSFERMRIGIFALFGQAKSFRHILILPWEKLREEAAMLAASRVCDKTLDPNMRRAIFYELSLWGTDSCGQAWEDIAAIHEACSKQPNADPWLIHMLAGRSYVAQAWRDRGGDWASKVTESGWEWFFKNLRKAADEYAEAMQLHPENPEAASDMITVAMGLGGKGDKTPKEWFDMAVAAQFDYMPAYHRFLWSIRQRWGGSDEEVYAFGCQCADTKRVVSLHAGSHQQHPHAQVGANGRNGRF